MTEQQKTYRLYATSPAPNQEDLCETLKGDERISDCRVLENGYVEIDADYEPEGFFIDQLEEDYCCLVDETIEELEKKLYGE